MTESDWARDNRRERQELYRERQRGKGIYSETFKRYKMKQRYGITQQKWDAIFERQGRVCAICKSSDPKSIKGWHTDHNHITMVVRGILCSSCNTAIGMIERHYLPDKETIDAYLQKGKTDA